MVDWSRFFSAARHGILRFLVLLLTIAPTLFAQSLPFDEDEQETGEEIIARELFLHMRRAGGPGKTLPVDAYANAVRERLSLEAASPYRPTGNWQSVNPTGMFYARTGNNYISGRTNSIAFHPSNPDIMYIGAAGGGVWKTTDGGLNWVVLTDHLTSISAGAVAVDQNDPNVVYYGTGELNFSGDSYYGDGVYKSTDAGTSWTRIAGTSVGRYISQISIDPTNSDIVYLSGSNGVYKSTNAGANWSSTSSGTNANCVLIDPTNPTILYATVGGSGGNTTRRSTDAGASWTILGGLPGAASAGRTQLAMAASNANVLYASVTNRSTSGLLGLYKTTDGGGTWTLENSSTNYLGGQGWYDNAVTVLPSNPDFVVVGGLDIYTSGNSGSTLTKKTTWSTTNSTVMSHADIHFLGFNNGVLYCGSDGGVYKSTDNGNSWTDLNATLSTLQFQSADYDPTDPLKIYGGTQDNNLETSTDGGTLWIQRTTGDGGYSVVDPVNPNYVYGQYVNGSIKRSANYGINFTDIEPNGSSGGLFYNPYEMAPGDHNTIVYGQADLWKTTNAQTATSSSGWTQIAGGGTIGGSVSAIGISRADHNKIYVGTSNGRILITTDNGSSWTTSSGYPYVSDLFVDDNNDQICYASFGGTNGSLHVFKTTNSGGSWNNITGNLPNIPVNTIAVRTAAPRMIFVGTDLGVFQSTDEGSTWISFNNDLPPASVYDLKYKLEPNILLAATHGRGCFMYTDLPPLPGIRMAVSPTFIDFGRVEASVPSDTSSLTIENRGSETIVISSVTHVQSEYALLNVPALPFQILAGQAVEVGIVFSPSGHGIVGDTLTLINNDTLNSVTNVVLTGKGVVIGQTARGVLYAASAGSGSKLYTVELGTGAATIVGETGVNEIDGLAIRPTTKELWGLFGGLTEGMLYRMSHEYGDALLVTSVSVPALRAIAFSAADVLYAGTSTGNLYAVDPSTGAATLVGTSTGIFYAGLSFSPTSGLLWASVNPPIVGKDNIYQVSTATGQTTLIGASGGGATPGLAFNSNGVLYGLKGVNTQIDTLIMIDTLTAAGTRIGSTGIAGLMAIAMRPDGLTGASEQDNEGVPASYVLEQNYPNPFNPSTVIRYGLPRASHIVLGVYNLLGQRVAELVNGEMAPGYHEIVFEREGLSSGVYFYRLQAGDFHAVRKLVLLK